MSRPPLPPFTADTAAQKVRLAEDAWNGRDPRAVSLAYSEESRWRNRPISARRAASGNAAGVVGSARHAGRVQERT